MKVHCVAVPADRAVAVYVPVAVDEVIHKAAIPFAACHDVMQIDFPRFSEQCEKFFRHILCCRKMTAVLPPSKKREGLCLVCSCRITF
ncbi:hypothetical protein [uncultured Bacteroides sp.]|uniref:hypothetical protein n=1 Tax=uncultured Bacteroides sp. TaxID=162156 RepID=UPI00260964B7|nr:hypothetical protein [uncultured Bacteroides sp.]